MLIQLTGEDVEDLLVEVAARAITFEHLDNTLLDIRVVDHLLLEVVGAKSFDEGVLCHLLSHVSMLSLIFNELLDHLFEVRGYFVVPDFLGHFEGVGTEGGGGNA